MKILFEVFLASILCCSWTQGQEIRQDVSLGTNAVQIDIGQYVTNFVSDTNGFKIGTFFANLPITNTTDQPIALAFAGPSGSAVLLPKDEYFARIMLYDASNHPVAKTELGERFKLAGNIQWDKKYLRSRPDSPRYFILRPQFTVLALMDLPSAAQMFKIYKPGKYRLVVEAEVCNVIRPGQKQTVRYPPLEIPLVEPGGR